MERNLVEEHFTEGEPDLEPPEELAVGELDDETMLEEDLDNEDVLEEDVDEDVLEVTLEHLVHADDEIDVEEDADPGASGDTAHYGPGGTGRPPAPGHDGDGGPSANGHVGEGTGHDGAGDDESGVEDDGEDDAEQALDQILRTRLALVDLDGLVEEPGDGEITTTVVRVAVDADGAVVAPCAADEFVCRSCFLVRKRVQLADAGAALCHDCAP